MTDERISSFDSGRRKLLAGIVAALGLVCLPFSLSTNARQKQVPGGRTMDIERFVEDCIAANREADAQRAVKDVLERLVSEPGAVIKALGEPREAGINVLHRSNQLTIFNAVWTPQMNLMPHNHLMWANIGIYTGREDNLLWRRTPEGIKASGVDALFEKDTAMLPSDVIHSVTNPLQRFTGGIHIYAGDFFATTRSQWDPETLTEGPSDGAAIRAIFEQENARLAASRCD